MCVIVTGVEMCVIVTGVEMCHCDRCRNVYYVLC